MNYFYVAYQHELGVGCMAIAQNKEDKEFLIGDFVLAQKRTKSNIVPIFWKKISETQYNNIKATKK